MFDRELTVTRDDLRANLQSIGVATVKFCYFWDDLPDAVPVEELSFKDASGKDMSPAMWPFYLPDIARAIEAEMEDLQNESAELGNYQYSLDLRTGNATAVKFAYRETVTYYPLDSDSPLTFDFFEQDDPQDPFYEVEERAQ